MSRSFIKKKKKKKIIIWKLHADGESQRKKNANAQNKITRSHNLGVISYKNAIQSSN